MEYHSWHGPNPNPRLQKPPAASNDALVRELKGIVRARKDLDALQEREKRRQGEVVSTLSQRVKAVEKDRAVAREEKRLKEIRLLVEERDRLLKGVEKDLEKERKEGLKMQTELKGTKTALKEVGGKEKAKGEPSGAVTAFLRLAMLAKMIIDFIIKHFVDGIFKVTGSSTVVLILILIYYT